MSCGSNPPSQPALRWTAHRNQNNAAVFLKMTRGVLIDVAALKRVEMLPDAYAITRQDLEQALQQQNVKLQPGDAVLIHTGWGRLWGEDNSRYLKSDPALISARRNGWRAKIRCWWGPTIGRLKSDRTRIKTCRYRFTKSCWSSTASICSRTWT